MSAGIGDQVNLSRCGAIAALDCQQRHRTLLNIEVVIPALNEAAAVGGVVGSIPRPPVRGVSVVDNGSTDGTAEAARAAGAQVIVEPQRGYGAACRAGLRALPADTDIVVFLDADGSDDPSLVPELVHPIVVGAADLVVGSRTVGKIDRGALTMQQRIGNFVATRWLRLRFGLPATDLGPFRAIRKHCLDQLVMSDPDYGWTAEMQVKAARSNLRYVEVAVLYRARIGRSKISGTLRGTIGASRKIVGLLM